MTPPPTSAVFVRIPTAEAEKLDRAAFELKTPKRELIAGLVSRYVDPSTPSGLASLRALERRPRPAGFRLEESEEEAPAGAHLPRAGVRRVLVEAGADPLTVGHHDFHAGEPLEVLTPRQVAHLLQVEEDAVLAMAEAGTLPGRRIDRHWRFARRAVLDWLAAGDSDDEEG